MKIFKPIKRHYPNIILKQKNNILQHFEYKMNKTKTNHEKFLKKSDWFDVCIHFKV